MKIPYVKEHPDTAFVMLASNLNRLLDKGESLTINDTFDMCDNHSLIPWLERNADLSFWDDDSKRIMAFEFEAYAQCYGPRGFENNGICFIIDMALSFVKNPPKRTIKDCSEDN